MYCVGLTGGGTGGARAARGATGWSRTAWHCAARFIISAYTSAKVRNAYEARQIAELVESGRRTVKPHQCRCGADCLRGEDHDECAMTAIVDIEPVDSLDETLAVLNGLHTYDICPQRGKTAKRGAYILYHRESWNVESAKRTYPVLVQHVCRKAA